MSADTTMVVAVINFDTPSEKSTRKYTARVVQAVENLLDNDREAAFFVASLCFLGGVWPMFSTLGRAKSFAALLRSDTYIEYDELVVIEIVPAERRVYRLTKRGKRIPDSAT